MQYSPLSLIKHRVEVGAPLPFNVRHADRTLLLARGQVIQSADQLANLFARGALVDLAELTTTDVVAMAQPKELPRLWKRCLTQLSDSLRHAGDAGFREALDTATPPVLALVERDKDLAIFQVLRQDTNAFVQYGIEHASHAGICAWLVAQRLGWSDSESQRVFKAALTMNVAMLELQGQLAEQTTPPTPEQRAAIHAHPEAGRALLELSGVTDASWLRAVAEHHEHHDGSGYPHGLREVCDLAALVRRADIYTAKLSPRKNREAIAADQAGRMMFMQDAGHPMTAALVKEFGVYPPGCWVKLANGESGVVVRRGATVMAPIVAVFISPVGATLAEPQRRDTSHPSHAVHSVLGTQRRKLPVAPDVLVAMGAA
jgi:HD-GYP domain-containing protein (c-di-GMP phosphodiesterase class II)